MKFTSKVVCACILINSMMMAGCQEDSTNRNTGTGSGSGTGTGTGTGVDGATAKRVVDAGLTGLYFRGYQPILITPDGQFLAAVGRYDMAAQITHSRYDESSGDYYFDIQGAALYEDASPTNVSIKDGMWDGTKLRVQYDLSNGVSFSDTHGDPTSSLPQAFEGDVKFDTELGNGIALRFNHDGSITKSSLYESKCDVSGEFLRGLDGFHYFDIQFRNCDVEGDYSGAGISFFGSVQYRDCEVGIRYAIALHNEDKSKYLYDGCMSRN